LEKSSQTGSARASATPASRVARWLP
jgi:hypothetical protein